MLCPVDKIELVMSERSGVEIDYCPTCRGVWLDRGELDKIIDRAGAAAPPTARPHAPSAPPVAPHLPPPLLDRGRVDAEYRRRYDDDYRPSDHDRRGNEQYGRKPYRKKKDNWLGEMFDF